MKRLPVLPVFTIVLVCFLASSSSALVMESKISRIQNVPQDPFDQNVAEYCQKAPDENASYSVISDEEYAIYAALVEELVKSQNLKSMNVDKKIYSICKGDSQKYFLEKDIPTEVPVNVNTSEEVKNFNSNRTFSGDIVGQFSFSRVAFNKDHTQAFVKSRGSRSRRCPFGQSDIFTIDNGRWKHLQTASFWIS